MVEQAKVLGAASALATAIQETHVPARLLGGTAVYFQCPAAREGPFTRSYHDVDAIVEEEAVGEFTQILDGLGFVADKRFNTLYGDKRLLFNREGVVLDVFVRYFEQCHKLDFKGRLSGSGVAVSPTELLLTKLQIVEINEKDMLDLMAILVDWAMGHYTIDTLTIAALTAKDWGWHTTIGDNLEKLRLLAHQRFNHSELDDQVNSQVQVIQDAMDQHPKSLAWTLRAKVGRRVRWYTLPDEK
ncbi:MAG: hypothetical protein OWU33_04040 [Firmicutes bacterium]|nr:hypothetical protein [Bacillota bacterium]